jgi:pilus assembly protein CpaB
VSRRRRSLLFAALAMLCAVASASLAIGYRERVDADLGEVVQAVVLERDLAAGERLGRRQLRGALAVRSVPARFLPPDALARAEDALGRRARAALPAGSYLLASQLRSEVGGTRTGHSLPAGRRPLQLTVAGAAALRAAGRGASFAGGRVDVVVAEEPRAGSRGRVRLAARAVRLLDLQPADDRSDPLDSGWSATVAVRHEQALKLIEADNYAREIRLIPR